MVLLSKAAQISPRFCKHPLLHTTFFPLCSSLCTRLLLHSAIWINACGESTAIYDNFKNLDLHTFKDKVLSVFLI